MPTLDYDLAASLLEEYFTQAESQFLDQQDPPIDHRLTADFDQLFDSKTQAYREVLLGCIIAKIQNESFDIRLPYINQGDSAYNGRTLDERTINPFLRQKKIPCSKGPFLSVFRRSVKFDSATRDGVRDKAGYDALLRVIDFIEKTDRDGWSELLRYHLYRFVILREQSKIELMKLRRISLEQCERLIAKLIAVQSGGRYPVFLIVATFQALNEVFGLNWRIEYQGINVADKAAGAGGDITIKLGETIILAAEITERHVDHQRVIATFDTKIAPNFIEDYLFFVKDRAVSPQTLQQARQYFSQGHEVNFLELGNWMVAVLSILGGKGRSIFLAKLVDFLEGRDIPKIMKLSWNEAIGEIIAS